jgi:DNA-binding FadR family transcriptional regulator
MVKDNHGHPRDSTNFLIGSEEQPQLTLRGLKSAIPIAIGATNRLLIGTNPALDRTMDAPSKATEQGTLTQLRAYLQQTALGPSGQLPPERQLAAALDVSRADLRKALAALEAEGQLWRHVGKGTFLGERPRSAMDQVASLARLTNPVEVMRARLAVEPELARLAALHANAQQIEELTGFIADSRAAHSWRQYELADARFHREIAEAAGNAVLLAVYDLVSDVRRAVTWTRLRPRAEGPSPDHHSFAEHQAILGAITQRQPAQAAAAMRLHLASVERRLNGEE